MAKSESNCSYLRQYWKHKKGRPHFEMAGLGNFVIIISRNLLLKLCWQINATNYIKNQDDIQVILHTVMFRGTPCTIKTKKNAYSCLICWHLKKYFKLICLLKVGKYRGTGCPTKNDSCKTIWKSPLFSEFKHFVVNLLLHV